MAEDMNAAAPGIEQIPAAGDEPMSANEAARMITNFRVKRDEQPQAEAPPPAAAPQETPPPEAATAPAEEATSSEEATATTEPAELPPIEPPRSWSKEWKEEFKSYPRELQEKVAAREQDRETNLRRGQNDLAEQRKAFEAQRQQVEQARLQYENALPQLLQVLHQQQMGEFSDIKTMADVENLARTDWPRYALWDAQQKKVAAVAQEMRQAEARQNQEKEAASVKFAAEQDAKFLERHPEFADTDKATKTAQTVIDALTERGYTRDEIAKHWSNDWRDYRMQEILLDAAKFREAQKAVPAKVAKPVPPVQRPGVAPAKGASEDARIKQLEAQFNRTGNPKDAAELLRAKRAAKG